MDREIKKTPNGYVIHLYQYAHRYKYNNDGCIQFFNYLIDRRTSENEDPHDLDSDYLTFGDFDLLQVVKVSTFRQYHDVSALAKEWLGKRQSVLLYDISGGSSRINYDDTNKIWIELPSKKQNKTFFCLTMLTLTNELIETTNNFGNLLRTLRNTIINIVDSLNSKNLCEIGCEVFGTFNASEIGVIWLSDQYVDVLKIVNYIKHIKIKDVNGKTEAAFHNSYSVISTKENANTNNVHGMALVQFTEHEFIENHIKLKGIAKKITNNTKNISFSVGKHDVTLCVPANEAIKLIKRGGILSVGERGDKTGKFQNSYRTILSNNIRLLYTEDLNTDFEAALLELEKNEFFLCKWKDKFSNFNRFLRWEEFKISQGQKEQSNASYYYEIRKQLKKNVSASAGAVDSLDLLYTDYCSAIASSYSAMWSDDLHQQFKAVLEAIWNLISADRIPQFWDNFLELTNAFKQQIYHLSQSNQSFFYIPSCHLRSTGQYDFLMHAYYGITKKIIELIYLIQDVDKQSELVPLITVNTVPQVRSQLYFELGNRDDRRVINLDIPNSVIFDIQRGTWYLSHELFHYAAPGSRRERNYLMGIWLLSEIFLSQYLYLFIRVLSLNKDGIINTSVESKLKRVYGFYDERDIDSDSTLSLLDDLKSLILLFVIQNYTEIECKLRDTCDTDVVCSEYQRAIVLFSMGEKSEIIFSTLFKELFEKTCEQLCKEIKRQKDEDVQKQIIDRIKYCARAESYIEKFVATQKQYRIHFNNNDSGKGDWTIGTTQIDYVLEKWRGVREACSDVAMISLNSIPPEDYFLFCVQTLTDNRKNRNCAKEEMRFPNEIPQWIRFGLVSEYFCIQKEKSIFGWEINTNPNDDLFNSKARLSFVSKYIWTFLHERAKRDINSQWGSVADEIEKLERDAIEWLDFFAECRNYYLANYSRYYDLFFSPILDYYNVNSILKKQNEAGDYRKEIIEKIITCFSDNITEPYTRLFESLNLNTANIRDESNCESISDFYKIYHNKRFEYDVAIAQLFQNQKSLHDLMNFNETTWHSHIIRPKQNYDYTITTEMVKESFHSLHRYEDNERDICWNYHVRSLEELLFYIRFASEQFRNHDKDQNISKSDTMIWFRGHSSENYKLYPTVMRKYEESARECYPSLRNYHQSNYEVFKFRADGSLEMPSGIQFTKSDYIALMQHYSVPSNFLDWTDNAFTSLFMALKYFFDDKTEKQRNVVLYVFNPARYNKIRRQLISDIKDYDGLKDQKWFDSLRKQENFYSSLIPNLSIKENEERFEGFLLGDTSFDLFYASAKTTDYTISDYYLPMAILTSRLNPRIQTQNGNFVAFNLYTPPNKEEICINGNRSTYLFRYYSLENIQEKLLSKGVFLFRIVIDRACCKEVVEWLKSLGVSKENVYPELSEKSYHFS